MKKSALLGMVFLLSACSSSVQENDQAVVLAKQLFENFNRHDWIAMAGLYAEPAQFLDPSFGNKFVTKTRTETIAKYAAMNRMFPDIHDEVITIYPSHETVTVEFISTGTAPDGTMFSLPIVSILTIKNGQIVKDATYYDL